MTALARGERIATHRARLPAAVIAFERRALLSAEREESTQLAAQILHMLREQAAPPLGEARTRMSDSSSTRGADDDDPWAAMKQLAGY